MNQISKNRGTTVVGRLGVAMAVSLALSMAASVSYAQEGHPAAKATGLVTDITVMYTENGVFNWETVLEQTIKTPNGKDLFIDVSVVSSLMTQTEVKSKGGNKDTSTATAGINVRVLVDGSTVFPGSVTFAKRIQKLSAVFQGLIEDCIDHDTGTIDLHGHCVGGSNDGDHCEEDSDCDSGDCDTCLEPEEVELILETMSANSFNFIEADLSSGVHTVTVQVKPQLSSEAEEGSASAWAMFGPGSFTVQLVRMIKGELVELTD